ncbi:MAG: hypothetical protein ACREMY_28990, partial [bacterium]
VRKADGSDLDPKSVSLRSKVVSKVFSDEFRTFLDSREQWFEELKHFRDALAHRIPLYIPPFIIGPDVVEEYNRLERASYDALKARKLNEYESLRAEQEKLGRFRPWMTHSRSESAPTIVFHYQLLADFNTVDEFGRAMLDELER